MNHIKSNRQTETFVPSFPLPNSAEEFHALTYVQKAALFNTYPSIYNRFARTDLNGSNKLCK